MPGRLKPAMVPHPDAFGAKARPLVEPLRGDVAHLSDDSNLLRTNGIKPLERLGNEGLAHTLSPKLGGNAYQTYSASV